VCAIQNLWLAARTESIGLGWVSILSDETLKQNLEIPEHVILVAYLSLGYVDEFAKKPESESAGRLPRLQLSDVVYYEKWNNQESDEWLSIQGHIKANLNMRS